MLDFGFYNMDCLQGMKEFPDKYFGLAICDPPYGIDITHMTMGVGGVNVPKRTVTKIGGGIALTLKHTILSMMKSHRQRNTSKNLKECQSIV